MALLVDGDSSCRPMMGAVLRLILTAWRRCLRRLSRVFLTCPWLCGWQWERRLLGRSCRIHGVVSDVARVRRHDEAAGQCGESKGQGLIKGGCAIIIIDDRTCLKNTTPPPPPSRCANSFGQPSVLILQGRVDHHHVPRRRPPRRHQRSHSATEARCLLRPQRYDQLPR
jgi:hypothetical protein